MFNEYLRTWVTASGFSEKVILFLVVSVFFSHVSGFFCKILTQRHGHLTDISGP